jgi:O-methyltransferase
VLRLDTDHYRSTLHELNHLYPRLASGGILIVDDYGSHVGAREAVDEYFGCSVPRPFLCRIDHGGVLGVKA